MAADLYPAESNHMLDISELLKPEVRFFVARRGGVAPGCGSVVVSHGGAGVVFVLLKAIEDYVRLKNISDLRLETGIYSFAALALYRNNGFQPRPAFAPYAPDRCSVFMEKIL